MPSGNILQQGTTGTNTISAETHFDALVDFDGDVSFAAENTFLVNKPLDAGVDGVAETLYTFDFKGSDTDNEEFDAVEILIQAEDP